MSAGTLTGEAPTGRPAAVLLEPGRDCPLCPRLAAFRDKWRAEEPTWHNAPVSTFGALDSPVLLVGLAPGLRGANRTGRPFTGDFAGRLLYKTLIEFGFATGTYEARPDDSLRLVGLAIANAVRCVPPENKPTPAEIGTCRRFLAATMTAMPNLRAIVALGRVAHDSVLTAIGARRARYPFGHGAVHALTDTLGLHDSYHCSRYNTNTGVLTETMFRSVFQELRAALDR